MTTEQEKLEQEKQDLFPDFDVHLDDIEAPEEKEVNLEEEEEEEEVEEVEYGEDADDTAIGVFKTLQDKEIIFLNEDDKFDGTWESLETHLDKLPEQIATSIVEGMPEPLQKLVDYGLTKGNVTYDDLKEYFSVQEQDLASAKTEFESIEESRSYLTDVMKKQGYDPDVIDTTLDAMEDKGEDYIKNKAKSYAEKFKSQKADEILEQERINKAKAKKAQTEFFSSINNELTTLKYSDQRNQAIKSNLNPQVIAQKNASIKSSPKAIIQLADFYSYFDENTKEFDLKAFAEMAKSGKVKKIKENLISNNFSSSGAKNTSKKHSSKDSQEDEFVPVF